MRFRATFVTTAIMRADFFFDSDNQVTADAHVDELRHAFAGEECTPEALEQSKTADFFVDSIDMNDLALYACTEMRRFQMLPYPSDTGGKGNLTLRLTDGTFRK